jgi:hypothetical protein
MTSTHSHNRMLALLCSKTAHTAMLGTGNSNLLLNSTAQSALQSADRSLNTVLAAAGGSATCEQTL